MLLWCAGSLEWHKVMLWCSLKLLSHNRVWVLLFVSTDEVVFEVLPSQRFSHEAHSIVCEGSEATLADCFVRQDTVTTCHYVLVQCGDVANSEAGGSSASAVFGVVMAVPVVVVLVVVVLVVVVVAVLGVILWKANRKSQNNR